MKVLSKRLLNCGSQTQNFGKQKPRPKPAVKNVGKPKPKPKPNPSKIALKEAEAEAEANSLRMFESRSRPGSQHFCEKPGLRKPKPKPASNPTLIGCSYDLSISSTWLRRPKQGPCRTKKRLGAADLEFFSHAIVGLFHTTDMDSKGFLSSAQVALLDIKFDD